MNILLEYAGSSIKINNLGFITFWSKNPLITEKHPIYLVIFEEYSRLNPFCQPFNISENIQIETWDKNSVIYKQKVNKFLFNYKIILTSNGIDWSVLFDPISTNHSIGLAIPYYKKWSDFSKNYIKEDIANYSAFFHKDLFSDQHILDIPCVFSNDIIVFGNLEYSYKFFRYNDNNTRWIRVTTSTSIPTDMAVEICIRTNVTNATEIKKTYLKKFPQSIAFVDKWKIKFKELGKYFNLDILYQQSETKLSLGGMTYISKKSPTEKDLEKFYSVLKVELHKYPKSFFTNLNITCIQLVMNLWIQLNNKSHKIDGQLWFGENNGLIIDINATTAIIHHEIFHGIQTKKKFYSMPGKISQISNSIKITSISEYLAEVFALLMTNPGLAYAPNSGVTNKQIEYIKNELKEFLDFPDIISSKENRTLFAVVGSELHQISFGDIHETAVYYIYDPLIKDEL